jgi:tetrahydromethanopterin S-methyltransferase subunit B
MAFGILMTLTIYSLVAMIMLYTVKVESEWDSE